MDENRTRALRDELAALDREYEELSAEFDAVNKEYHEALLQGREKLYELHDRRSSRRIWFLAGIAIFCIGLTIGKSLALLF